MSNLAANNPTNEESEVIEVKPDPDIRMPGPRYYIELVDTEGERSEYNFVPDDPVYIDISHDRDFHMKQRHPLFNICYLFLRTNGRVCVVKSTRNAAGQEYTRVVPYNLEIGAKTIVGRKVRFGIQTPPGPSFSANDDIWDALDLKHCQLPPAPTYYSGGGPMKEAATQYRGRSPISSEKTSDRS